MARFIATAAVPEVTHRTLAPHGPIELTADNSQAALEASIDDEVIGIILRGSCGAPGGLIRDARGLRVIGRTGVGYDSVDVDAGHRVRGGGDQPRPAPTRPRWPRRRSPYLLALNKRIAYWDRQMKERNWASRERFAARDIAGLTVGIVGFGNIGQALARLLGPFGVTLLAHDPYADAAAARGLDVELVELDALLGRSDTVCLHTALTDQTRGMIDRGRIAAMKPGSFLINLARGGVVESLDAVLAGIEDGPLAGAALDVFDPEPPDFDHPIFRHPAVLTAPHAHGDDPRRHGPHGGDDGAGDGGGPQRRTAAPRGGQPGGARPRPGGGHRWLIRSPLTPSPLIRSALIRSASSSWTTRCTRSTATSTSAASPLRATMRAMPTRLRKRRWSGAAAPTS